MYPVNVIGTLDEEYNEKSPNPDVSAQGEEDAAANKTVATYYEFELNFAEFQPKASFR